MRVRRRVRDGAFSAHADFQPVSWGRRRATRAPRAICAPRVINYLRAFVPSKSNIPTLSFKRASRASNGRGRDATINERGRLFGTDESVRVSVQGQKSVLCVRILIFHIILIARHLLTRLARVKVISRSVRGKPPVLTILLVRLRRAPGASAEGRRARAGWRRVERWDNGASEVRDPRSPFPVTPYRLAR